MSMLSSLVRASGRLKDAPPFGYAMQDVQFFLEIDQSGAIIGKLQAFDYEKKGNPISRSLSVPYFGGRSGSSAPPYFLWDNSAYVLGISGKENFDAAKRFEGFRTLHLHALAKTTDSGLMALRRFLEAWSPEQFEALGFPQEAKDRNIVFRLTGMLNFVHESAEAAKIWSEIYVPDTIGEGICLISGERTRIARLHPPIKSFDNPARIVSFDKDNDAFSSFGHIQAENAPTGIIAAFQYTAVLNHFLSRDSGHRIQVGDASTVFWADASNAEVARTAEGTFGAMFSDIDEATQAGKVGDILARIRKGLPLKVVAPELENGVRFYVLGLAPNAARLSIRFWHENDFGALAKNYQRFVAEMDIDPPPRDAYPALWRYLAETAVLGKRDNVPPNLAGEWIRSILTGTRYPLTLLSTVLMRIRADGEVNALRVSILKALLIRNFNKAIGEAPVSFQPENRNKGYLLGRLFAAYEQIQTAALGRNVNATIKDKFYGSASAQPRKVFALLDRGSANHLSKVGKQRPGHRVNLEKAIGAILERMSPDDDPFPASLSAEDQALFSLGYYHQRGEFFRKPETVDTQDAAS